jgi:hypothetical protein
VGRDFQPPLGRRTADQPQHGLPGTQGLSSPIDTDLANSTVFPGNSELSFI